MRKLLLTIFVLVGLALVPLRHTIDREGFLRSPSLWDLFAPPVEGAYRASMIKSIQQASGTGGSVTISAVVLANSVVTWGGCSTTDAVSSLLYADALPSVSFASTTAVSVTFTVPLPTETCSVQVVEFFPNVLKQAVQTGSISLAGATDSNTATLSNAVVVAKTWLYSTFSNSGSSTTTAQTMKAKMVLTNTTTVTLSRGGHPDTNNVVGQFQAVEFR